MFFDSLSRNDKLPLKFKPSDLKIAACLQLANLVEVAIDNDASQDALRTSFVLTHTVTQFQKNLQDPVLQIQSKRLNLYSSAISLWKSKEVKTPIAMMHDLLEEGTEPIECLSNSSPEMKIRSLLEVSNDQVVANIVEWSSEMKMETSSAIFDKYINGREISLNDPSLRADVFYALGNFLNKEVRKLQESGEIDEKKKRCDAGIIDLNALELIYRNTKFPEDERKDAKRHFNRVKLQLNRDQELLKRLVTQRTNFVWTALRFYLNTLVYTNKHNSNVLDKFCGLWFENDKDVEINRKLYKDISAVPSWKFLSWVNQIASKLSIEETEFQKPLQLTMKRLLYKLPYDSLFSVLSIKLYEGYSMTMGSSINLKVKAVEQIFKELQGYENGKFYISYITPIEEFCKMSIELANVKFARNVRKLRLSNLNIGEYWMKRLPTFQIPLPTIHFPISCSADGRNARPYIVSVDETVSITTTGLSLPKIVTFTISDGSIHRVLMKGSNDDLRQDAIMEQVFQQVNNILKNDKQLRKFEMGIRTYKVIPLGPQAGIIEFVANSLALHQILSDLHQNDTLKFDQARKAMKSVQTKDADCRLRTYLKITEDIQPEMRNFFFDAFPDANEWLEAKRRYTKGVATTSIVGYLLGLGDRHLNNILIDRSTGEPIHIDLGIAFDQGRLLPIPELVPFRLTRDMIDGFGVTGVDGLFRRSCEKVYSVLRRDSEKMMCVLNVLKWDPLYSWVMSPVRKHKHLLEDDTDLYSSMSSKGNDVNDSEEENRESYRALKGVEEKLMGNGLNIEATVQELISQATDPANLAVIYMGWSPFY